MTFNHIQKFKDAFTKYYNGLMYKIKDLGNGNYEYYIPTGDSEELIGSYVNGIYWLKDQLTFAEHDASNPTSTGGIHDTRYVAPNYQIKIDGTWTTVGSIGSFGDVEGPASAVNNRIAVFDGITGKLIKDGGKTIADIEHDAVTVTDTDTIDLTLTGQDIQATIKADAVDDTMIDWGVGANQVSAVDVPIADVGVIITATEVEGALQENRTAININTAKVTNATHTGDVTGATELTIGAGKVTEVMQVLADNTTNDVSTSKHGYAPKGDGSTTKYLNANGAYTTPAGAGGTPTNIIVESPTMETSPTTGGCYLWSEDDSEWQQSQKGIGIYDGTDIVLKGQCTLSGLTAGLNYYADSSGDISATSSDYKVGLAISSTILIVDTAGDWGTAWSMPSGLTHYWPLATDGNDDVGTAHLTATSITYSGGWAIFNGSSSNYSIPSAGVAPVNTDWTEEIWIYADTLVDDRIVSVGDGSTLQRQSNATSSAITFTYRGADSANHTLTSTTTPSTSTVYQVIITHDYGTNTKLYINGSLEDTDTYTGNDAGQFNIGNYIGSQSGSSFYFDGKMRKRRIWTSVLTASEVSAMYNGGAGR